MGHVWVWVYGLFFTRFVSTTHPHTQTKYTHTLTHLHIIHSYTHVLLCSGNTSSEKATAAGNEWIDETPSTLLYTHHTKRCIYPTILHTTPCTCTLHILHTTPDTVKLRLGANDCEMRHKSHSYNWSCMYRHPCMHTDRFLYTNPDSIEPN